MIIDQYLPDFSVHCGHFSVLNDKSPWSQPFNEQHRLKNAACKTQFIPSSFSSASLISTLGTVGCFFQQHKNALRPTLRCTCSISHIYCLNPASDSCSLRGTFPISASCNRVKLCRSTLTHFTQYKHERELMCYHQRAMTSSTVTSDLEKEMSGGGIH